MDHAFYVYGSYGFAALTVIALISWTWIDGRLRRRELAALEASGIRRRSQRKKEATS
ncbi:MULTISPECIES: heme exporter protein CcmD [unclassified Rhizobium]|uniref:heme exporter protein CcmD n=1 Tax=unclassified Rhizobium TaxID=2613769 RepID=UPI001ADA936B|nr:MULTISPECIES: heme exporter protein CcmD [unclassified Rhizobium]MBO9100181.1 heme exporter protein CcmD [Rhizobium sp. L58/93]MBO9135662.1 heme exporter protein CcmD [Rhizobium sp. B209b/85]MBO9170147.1 heme exporter protein CcmD [Rhizobium sp. L245/93]MBO9186074.1 heme exporter protein CcmD [Rhizobium sp. E27B/91]QXZ83006.1 heme exporter protein CcmD [Rhizobium sp. K1/93]